MKAIIWALAVTAIAVTLLPGCSASSRRDDRTVTVRDPNNPPSQTAQDDWARWDREGPRWLRNRVGGWFSSRFYDFTDMFDVGLSGGKWVRLEAQYLIGFWGFGATECQRWRFGQRSFILNEETTTFSTLPFPASLILFPTMFGEDKALGTIVTLGGVSYEVEDALWPDPVFANIPHTRERIRITAIERDRPTGRFVVRGDSFPVGAELHFFIGARARVLPLQIVDFVTSFVGWDMLKDDIKPYVP